MRFMRSTTGFALPWQRRRRCAAVLLALALLAGSVGSAQNLFEAPMTIDNFQMRGVNEDGSPSWQVTGETAVLRGNLATLEGVAVVLQQREGGPLQLRSPQCVFNRVNKAGWSEARLEVLGQSLIIRGVGYDLLPDQKKLIVRDQVHMIITRSPAAVSSANRDQ